MIGIVTGCRGQPGVSGDADVAGPRQDASSAVDGRAADSAGHPMSDARSPTDAGQTSDAGADAEAFGTRTSGQIACYSEGSPGATCSLPIHCCFTNYSSAHNGSCSSSACSYGTLTCDGPEDCPNGQSCCAHAITDPNDGTIGYMTTCQTGGCGAAPLHQELCHPGTCSNGGMCVGAIGHDNDLPRVLSICE